ncbi:hypothetical protein BKA64DRAFT_699396 [Cadophora sp. MPI-SDFR-AT-0126]|nr:hypothetical protein BKA64DRAFT_699396 [Leotiomycetes sp. MPI-SDFR-AT-0126]
MEFPTTYDYAGNPWNGSTLMNNELLAPSLNDSDYDFSQMLNFTPPAGNLQNAMPNMPGNLQPTMGNMPGDYVGGSEYPFPSLPISTSLPTSTPANTLAPSALSLTSYSNVPTNASAPAGEPQLADLQVQREAERQSNEDETTQMGGQKRTKSTASNPDVAEEPKPKRRRGARKKVRTAEELAIKRENHLQRNRDAAQKCRQKKKLTEAEKKEQMIKERQDNHFAWNQVAMVEEELESFRNLAFDIDSSCDSDDHKAMAKNSLNKVSILAAQLQDRIDICNQRRAEIGQGLVMTKSFGGYVQQDSIPDAQDSMRDGQSPTMSAQNSTYLPGHGRSNSYATSTVSISDLPSVQHNRMGSRPMSRDISYAGNRITTDFASGVNMSRNGSSGSPGQTDSAIDFNSPPEGAKKEISIEDEGIENPMYPKDVPLPSLETMIPDADPSFAFLSQWTDGGAE